MGHLNIINFLLEQMENLLFLGVPILKHIRVGAPSFFFLQGDHFPKESTVIEKNFLHYLLLIFLYKLTPIMKGGKNENGRDVSSDTVPSHLNEISHI